MGQRCPPRELNNIIKSVLQFAEHSRLDLDARQLAIYAIKNSDNQREDRARPQTAGSVKQRYTQTDQHRSEGDLIWSNGCFPNLRRNPSFDRRVYERGNVQGPALSRILQ